VIFRFIAAILLAGVASTILFYLLALMIAPKESHEYHKEAPVQFDFIRNKESSELKRKERPRPPKPQKTPPPKLEKLEVNSPKKVEFKQAKMALDIPKLDFSLKGDSFLGNALIDGSGIRDMGLIPLVTIPPRYPKKAKRLKKEGYVKVLLQISAHGLVRSAKVIESKPKGFFEKEALRAVKKYKFKAKVINGKAVPNEGIQRIDFVLK
jgi:periplasmic protein TonB